MNTDIATPGRAKSASDIAGSRKSNGETEGNRQWNMSKDKVLEDFGALITDGEALLRSTAHLSEDTVNVARKRFEEKWKQAKTKLDDVQSTALEHGRRASVVADDYVNANPWKAIGVAGGIGLFIGLLLSRRS
jgi:ElaB/YqjD/DUF883 family membrane-anchored ribosome-binding protein